MMGFSVYVHLPYCRQRCHYCDFNAHAASTVPEQRYTDALLRELVDAGRSDNRPVAATVETVFFGGGTPSLFSPESIARILEAIDREFSIDTDAEITLEANPGTLEGGGFDKLAGFRSAGINRLSIGAQSFHPDLLRWLGRIHSPEHTDDAVRAARRAGFDNLSCDLMFAIPGQTLAMWQADLEHLIALEPDHVSAYNLTYEPGTALTRRLDRGRFTPAPEQDELDFFDAGRTTLAAAGFEHYEISNYARPGRRSRHNVGYWTWREYLGVGAGAHGFRIGRDGAPTDQPRGRRYSNVELPEAYMAADDHGRLATTELLSRESAIAEYVMMGMRMSDGIDDEDFRARFGEDLDAATTDLGEFVTRGLVERRDARTRLTADGIVLTDAVIDRMVAR